MRLLMLCLLLSAGLFTACKDSNPSTTTVKTDTRPEPPKQPASDLDKSQTDELINLLAAYYSLKDALVATNAAKADESASKLLSAAELFNSKVGGAPQATEIQPQLKKVMGGCDSLIAAKGDAIEDKRARFSNVSDAMYKVLKLANLKNSKVYLQYCPMALNDKGANWLSREEEIKNPYFGNKMLECGEVKDSL